jgi:hypothetical protein
LIITIGGADVMPLDAAERHQLLVLGLQLINYVLETAGSQMGKHESLLGTMQGELCKYLLLHSDSEDVVILSHTLRVVFNLFNSLKQHLKVHVAFTSSFVPRRFLGIVSATLYIFHVIVSTSFSRHHIRHVIYSPCHIHHVIFITLPCIIRCNSAQGPAGGVPDLRPPSYSREPLDDRRAKGARHGIPRCVFLLILDGIIIMLFI